MPKGKKKARRGEAGEGPSTNGGGGGGEGLDDAMSVASQSSAVSDDHMAAPPPEEEEEELSELDNMAEKLATCIDGMADKSVQRRLVGLKSLSAAFCKKYICELIEDRKVTIADNAERCLKRGSRVEERASAAVTLSLLFLQLGVGDDADESFEQVRQSLITALIDNKLSPTVRAACAATIGMGAFIASSEDVIEDLMSRLQSVFAQSFLKGDRTPPHHSPELCQLHAAALQAWCLLLTIRPSSAVRELIISQIKKIPEILQSSNLNLRIAAGEAIALLYEMIREQEGRFVNPKREELKLSLHELATDCSKYHAKKDRRSQRSTFRDIVETVEGGSPVEEEVMFGRQEVLYVSSWKGKLQYGAFSDMLGSGINTHLQTNPLLREVFGLGAAIPEDQPISKENKFEKKMYLQAASKARTQTRQKTRDKRIPRF